MQWHFVGFVALLLRLAIAAEQLTPAATCTTCYTRTTSLPAPCVPFNTQTCPPVPLCIVLKTTVIPTKSCDIVSTTFTCPTCQTGCATSTTTITAKESCVPTSPASCFTATTTSGTVNCPLQPVCTSESDSTVTITRPTSDPYCAYTPTVTVPPKCKTDCCWTTTSTVTAVPYGSGY